MKRFPKKLDMTIPEYEEDKHLYTPIHVHSSYSLFDSVSTIMEIPEVAKKLGMKAVSLSDHGTMSGTFSFVEHCKSSGVKPIVGCEFYVNPRRLKKDKDANNQHLCLFAMNMEGWKNLLKITYDAVTNGFYFRPRTDLDFIAEHSEGLICTTACMASPIIKPFLDDNKKQALNNLKKLKEVFGDRLYIEFQFNELDIQKKIVDWLEFITKRFGLKSLYGLDSHYTYPNDVYLQDIIKLNRRKMTVYDANWQEAIFDIRRLFIKPFQVALDEPEELGFKVTKQRVRSLLETTNELAGRIHFEFELGLHAPVYEHRGKAVDQAKFLKLQIQRGFLKKIKQGMIPKGQEEAYRKRTWYEYEQILKCGYPNYFLMIWDMVRVAVRRGIQKGIGRGSASGSLVSFVLDISGVDPIKHGLLFERFLDVERKDPPDIDLDWESERRNEIEDYLVEKYGKEKVAHVATFSYWGTKSALSEVFKTLGEDGSPIFEMSKWIRSDEKDIRYAKHVDDAIEWLRKYCPKNEVIDLVDRQMELGVPLAKRLVDNVRHVGLHAGGIVVSPKPIWEYIPVIQHKGKIVTGFPQSSEIRRGEWGTLEKIGLIKIDNLGVNSVSTIKATLLLIKERHDLDLFEHIWKVELDDSEVYRFYAECFTEGVFQVESDSINNFIRRLKPSNFSDICALMALYRPGSLQSGESERFIKRKAGKEKIEYVHPKLKKYLEDTYGCFVYQEQLMFIMQELAGFGKGEVLRKMKLLKQAYDVNNVDVLAMVKRLREELIRLSNFTEKQADELTEMMRKCYAYIFNKSHATSYAFFSYQMMWLKVHYPIEFFCGLLSRTENQITELKGGAIKLKIKKYISAAKKLGITVLPPKFGVSGSEFKIIDDSTIVAGTRIIVGIGKSAAELDKTVDDSCFEDFVCNENIQWQKLNKSKVEKLIKIGYFDDSVKTRKSITKKQLVHAWKLYNERKKKKCERDTIVEAIKESVKIVEGEYSKAELLEFQIQMFRFFFTEHPLESKDIVNLIWKYNKKQSKKALKIRKVSELNSSSAKRGTMIGYISSIRRTVPKCGPSKGEQMAIVTIEDNRDKARVLIWPEFYEIPEYKKLLKEGNVLVLRLKRKKQSGEEDSKVYELADISGKAQLVSAVDLGRRIKRNTKRKKE